MVHDYTPYTVLCFGHPLIDALYNSILNLGVCVNEQYMLIIRSIPVCSCQNTVLAVVCAPCDIAGQELGMSLSGGRETSSVSTMRCLLCGLEWKNFQYHDVCTSNIAVSSSL